MKNKLIVLCIICAAWPCALMRAMGTTDLLSAVHDDNVAAIRAYQGDVNQLIACKNSLESVLAVAIREHKLDAFDALLWKKGANPNQSMINFNKTNQGDGLQGYMSTPLHLAAQMGNCSALISLLEAGADANAKDSLGLPPLWYAARQGFTACAAFLALNRSDLITQYNGKDICEIASPSTANVLNLIGSGKAKAALIWVAENLGLTISERLIDFKNSSFYPIVSRCFKRI